MSLSGTAFGGETNLRHWSRKCWRRLSFKRRHSHFSRYVDQRAQHVALPCVPSIPARRSHFLPARSRQVPLCHSTTTAPPLPSNGRCSTITAKKSGSTVLCCNGGSAHFTVYPSATTMSSPHASPSQIPSLGITATPEMGSVVGLVIFCRNISTSSLSITYVGCSQHLGVVLPPMVFLSPLMPALQLLIWRDVGNKGSKTVGSGVSAF